MSTNTELQGTPGSVPPQHVWEPLLTSDEAASRLRIHAKTVIRMARRDEVPAVRIGKLWRFRESDLTRWIDDQVRSGCQPSGRTEN